MGGMDVRPKSALIRINKEVIATEIFIPKMNNQAIAEYVRRDLQSTLPGVSISPGFSTVRQQAWFFGARQADD